MPRRIAIWVTLYEARTLPGGRRVVRAGDTITPFLAKRLIIWATSMLPTTFLKAIEAFKRAVQIKADFSLAHLNLGCHTGSTEIFPSHLRFRRPSV